MLFRSHDEVFSDYCGFSFANIKVRKNRIHTTANNKRLLLMHGHEFDGIVLNSKWLAKLGAALYEYSVWFNNILNFCRRKLGLSYWSLSGYLKTRVKDAQRFIENFENNTQIKQTGKYVVKNNNELYDDFYVDIYDKLVYSDTKNQYEISALQEKANLDKIGRAHV